MSAAEFKVKVPAGWSVLAAVPQNGFLDAGPAPVANGKNFLLAVGSCPVGAVVAANLLISAPGTDGRVGFTISDDIPGAGLSQVAGTVDCDPAPTLNLWPELMRCVGFASNGALPFQNHGQDCTVTTVESETWGKVKGLYR
jgi:hypothetical protein